MMVLQVTLRLQLVQITVDTGFSKTDSDTRSDKRAVQITIVEMTQLLILPVSQSSHHTAACTGTSVPPTPTTAWLAPQGGYHADPWIPGNWH